MSDDNKIIVLPLSKTQQQSKELKFSFDEIQIFIKILDYIRQLSTDKSGYITFDSETITITIEHTKTEETFGKEEIGTKSSSSKDEISIWFFGPSSYQTATLNILEGLQKLDVSNEEKNL